MYVVNRTRGTYLGVDIKMANSFRTRMLGLHTDRQLHFGDGVWLVPCNSVHTIGMRSSIDVIFLNTGGRIVRVVENLRPGRIVWRVPEAHSALEVPAGVVRSGETQVGDQVEFVEDVSRLSRDESRRRMGETAADLSPEEAAATEAATGRSSSVAPHHFGAAPPMVRGFRKPGRELAVDVMAGIGWAIYASIYLGRVLRGEGLVDLGLVVFFTLLTVLFVMRRPARKVGAFWETMLAFATIVFPIVVLRPAPGGLPGPGEIIQVISLAGMIAALISLGRSFGIAPADRGLRITGLYRWVRHPLYLSELCFYLGYLVTNPSWRNLIGSCVVTVLQVVRIVREERILDGYADYAQQVRWRLLPFAW